MRCFILMFFLLHSAVLAKGIPETEGKEHLSYLGKSGAVATLNEKEPDEWKRNLSQSNQNATTKELSAAPSDVIVYKLDEPLDILNFEDIGMMQSEASMGGSAALGTVGANVNPVISAGSKPYAFLSPKQIQRLLKKMYFLMTSPKKPDLLNTSTPLVPSAPSEDH
jgi:hypothetical protein